MNTVVNIYDTTLRDGAQDKKINFSVDDMLLIAKKLDEFGGIRYIEGGWPGSNDKYDKFFELAKGIKFVNSILGAFGATHLAKFAKAHQDPNIQALLVAETPVVTIVGKTWDFQVKEALEISDQKNFDLIFNTIAYLKKKVLQVFFDAEHFFDGYQANREYALLCLKTAFEAGADCLILCDTNGGTITSKIGEIVKDIVAQFSIPIGIHTHNDSGLAVANSIMAVENGVSQVQGTVNGWGERCGNADLIQVIPNLKLKLGINCISDERLTSLQKVSNSVTEVANLRPFDGQPYVGRNAFAHKGGLHASGIGKNSATYEHIKPELVGNQSQVITSELGGRSNIIAKIKEFKLKVEHDPMIVNKIVKDLKELENQGYVFEGADASLELLIKKAFGQHKKFFELVGRRVTDAQESESRPQLTEASVRIIVGGELEHTAAMGNGPVNALDAALRKALEKFYPVLKGVKLIDFKVRVLKAGDGTAAKVRVLMESGNGEGTWWTVGVSENIIEASYEALVDSIDYKLLKEEEK